MATCEGDVRTYEEKKHGNGQKKISPLLRWTAQIKYWFCRVDPTLNWTLDVLQQREIGGKEQYFECYSALTIWGEGCIVFVVFACICAYVCDVFNVSMVGESLTHVFCVFCVCFIVFVFVFVVCVCVFVLWEGGVGDSLTL